MYQKRRTHEPLWSENSPIIRRFALTFMAPLTLAFLTYCLNSEKPPTTIIPVIIETLPRDSSAFTQGFFFHKGRLYESHGLYGHSGLQVIDSKSGSTLKRIECPPNLFAEGCTEFNGSLVQLTWREQTAFVYRLPDLDKRNTLTYAGEGWGLTSDGVRFYMSDGTDTITVRNNDFTIIRRIAVRANGMPVSKLNELEWAAGKLYANIWYSDRIAEIDPKSGRVMRFIDCSELIRRENPGSPDYVLNGIAFDPAANIFYLTGKKWKNCFLVKLAPNL
jgi:glutamine cyclotransferase